MFNSNKHRQAGQNVFMGSVKGLANVIAFIAAFLLTPQLYYWSVDWVSNYVASVYGPAFFNPSRFVWFCTTALLVFFISRATIGTALVFGGLAIVTRLM